MQQFRRGCGHDVSVGIDDIDRRSRGAKCVGNHVAGIWRGRAVFFFRLIDRPGSRPGLLRHNCREPAPPAGPLGVRPRLWLRRLRLPSDLQFCPKVAPRNGAHRVGAGQNRPVIGIERAQRMVKRRGIGRWPNLQHRYFHRLGTERNRPRSICSPGEGRALQGFASLPARGGLEAAPPSSGGSARGIAACRQQRACACFHQHGAVSRPSATGLSFSRTLR